MLLVWTEAGRVRHYFHDGLVAPIGKKDLLGDSVGYLEDLGCADQGDPLGVHQIDQLIFCFFVDKLAR